MLDKPQLVGERRSATGAIGRQLRILRETDGRRKLHRLSSVMAGVAGNARREQEGLDIHSLCELNALRHTRQCKPKYS